MKNKLILLLSFILLASISQGQTTKTVGGTGANYATLQLAFGAINSGAIQGQIVLQITGNTTESGSAFLNASGYGHSNYTSVLIYPTSSSLGITGSFDAPTIDLRGADKVTIDGRVNLVGSTADLIISNSNTGTFASAIKFITSAENNTVRYCTVKSACYSAGVGVIYFTSSTSGNGNDNNIIENCNITNAGGTRPINVIFSSGSSERENSGNIIRNNNIYDFFNSNANSYGINVSNGSTDWTVTGNSFYETTTFAPAGAYKYYPIFITVGNNNLISNNYIGGSEPLCAGSAFTVNSSLAHYFCGIYFSGGTTSTVQNNSIRNINYTSSQSVPWDGIYINSGNANVTGNTIGAITGNGSITLTNIIAAATSYGIRVSSSGSVIIANNSIGSITALGSITNSYSFIGIYKSTFSGTLSITNNLIGSTTTSNSIQAPSESTSSTGQNINGIYSTSTGLVNISNNTVANLYNGYAYQYATNGQITGITAGSGINTIQNNIVRDLSSSSPCNNTTFYAAVIGIVQKSTAAGQLVSNNTIYNLASTYTGSRDINVIGIHYSGATSGTNKVVNNFIHSLTLASNSITSAISGIRILSGSCTYANNIIYLGSGISRGNALFGIYENSTSSDNSKIYFNTIYLSGSRSESISSTYAYYNFDNLSSRDIRNNILYNAVTGGSTGKHYAIHLAGMANVTIDNNNYFVNGSGSVLGSIAALDKTDLATWKSGTSQDANSLNIDPGFANSGGISALDYYASATLPGVSGTGITTDFVGLTKGDPPKMGALETNNYVWQGSISTDYNTPANWSGGAIPPAGADIVFATSPNNNCLLDQNRTIGNITNAQGSYKLVVNGKQLTINKNLIFSGGAQIDATATSSDVVFAGSSAQSIPSGAFVSNTIYSLSADNSNGLTLSGDLTITQSLALTNGNFSIGSNTLTLNGVITTASGTITGGISSNVSIGGSGTTTTLPAISLNNLTLDRSSGISLGGDVSVAGTLVLSSGTLTIGANALTISGNSPGSTTGNIDANNASSYVIFSNASAITLPATFFSGTVTNLTLSGAGGVTAGSNITVNGVLNLAAANPSATRGLLEMTINYSNYPGTLITDYLNSHILNMGATATTIGIGDVTGTVKRATIVANSPYTFGNQYTTISLTDGIMPTTLAVTITIGTTPGNTAPSDDKIRDAVRRTYEIVPTGGSGSTVTANFHYLDSELTSSLTSYVNTELKLTTMDYDIDISGHGALYSDEHGRANYDYTNNYIGLSSVPISYFIQIPATHEWRTIFALREYGVDYFTWNGSKNTDWEDAANWTLPYSGSGIPTPLSHVIIPDAESTNNLSPILPSGITTINTISIENGGILTMGSNTLKIQNFFSGGWEDQNPLGNDPGTSTVIFNRPNTTISGNARFYNVQIDAIDAATDTIADITNEAGSTMKIAGSITRTGLGTGKWYADIFDATIEYNGGDQTVIHPDGTPDYHHLILSGSGTKNMPASALSLHGNLTLTGTVSAIAAGNMAIGGNLNLGSGTTFETGAFTQEVKGDIICDGTFTATLGSSLTLNGSQKQSIGGTTSPITFRVLTITNTNGVTLFNNTSTEAINISSGALTVLAGKSLTATGSTTITPAQGLVLKSDATGTASYIDNGTITGTARIERYLTPYNEITDLRFHFLSSPVSNSQAIATEFNDLSNSEITDFYKFDEPSNNWVNFRGSSYNIRNDAFGDDYNFVAGKGYLVAYPSAVTKNFTGVPYTNVTGLTIACTNTPGAGSGWNLIGNPYPSSINWESVTLGTGMDAALYYYDNSTRGYKYYTYFSGGLGGASQYIAPMQGFMVHAKTSGTQTVTIPNAARTHEGQDVFYKNAALATNILDLKLEGNAKEDYARICFYDLATVIFDGDYDAYKLFSTSETAAELYSVTNNNTSLAINTLPTVVMEGGVVPVSFKTSTAGNYTITAEKINSFDANTSITLEDKAINTFQNLNDNPVYNFTATTQELTERFVLHFKNNTTSISETETENVFTISIINGVVKVDAATTGATGIVRITDITGRTIATENLVSGAPTLLNLKAKPGVYLVSIYTSNNIFSRKVIVY